MQEVLKKKKPWWLFIWDIQTPYFASNQPTEHYLFYPNMIYYLY